MRILKFDLLYPADYFLQLREDNKALIDQLSFEEYVQWIHSLKIGYGDTISRELKNAGCEVQDYYNQDAVFLQKLIQKYQFKTGFMQNLFSNNSSFLKTLSLKTILQYRRIKKVRQDVQKNILLRKFIDAYKPDVIFLREPCHVDNAIFRDIKDQYLITTLIGCNIAHPINWQAHTSDLIFTIFPHYRTFFEANRINCSLFEYGIDDSVYEAVKELPKLHDVVFVGLLGTEEQYQKTRLMEYMAQRFHFKWWGPKGNQIDQFPNLKKSWQGYTAGMEMYKIYRQAKIVLNDYVDTAGTTGVNMRIKEVMGVGSFLLTRFAENIRLLEGENVMKTFKSETECSALIDHYLLHEEERETIARNGYAYSSKHYNSRQMMEPMLKDIAAALQKKNT